MALTKRALIFGITGQDGSYLAELLLLKGYEVFGVVRRQATRTFPNIDHLLSEVTLIDGDLLDQSSIEAAIIQAQPHEIYNLAAQSFVAESWKHPIADAEMNALGTLRILEAMRKFNPHAKFYQASTSEMFGNSPAPQDENTALAPRSPYGVAKLFAHHIVKNYRESYGMFACSGILFNHESPRRGIQFVTRKISNAVARIHLGLQDKLELGNLDAKRDWGFAGDYVQAMWLMLQQDEPQDFVIASGETHTIKEFLELAFNQVGRNWQDHVVQNPAFMRPAEVNHLEGNADLAWEKLGWRPTVTFKGLVEMMVLADIEKNTKELK